MGPWICTGTQESCLSPLPVGTRYGCTGGGTGGPNLHWAWETQPDRWCLTCSQAKFWKLSMHTHKCLRFNKSLPQQREMDSPDISLNIFTYQHFLPWRIGVSSINDTLCLTELSFSFTPSMYFFPSPFSPDYVWLCPTKFLSLLFTACKYFVGLSHCIWATTSPRSIYICPHASVPPDPLFFAALSGRVCRFCLVLKGQRKV